MKTEVGEVRRFYVVLLNNSMFLMIFKAGSASVSPRRRMVVDTTTAGEEVYLGSPLPVKGGGLAPPTSPMRSANVVSASVSAAAVLTMDDDYEERMIVDQGVLKQVKKRKKNQVCVLVWSSSHVFYFYFSYLHSNRQ